MQARSTANGKIRRKIQNPQMFETDPESFSPAIYFIITRGSAAQISANHVVKKKV
jgi:hypothetical protein